MPKIVNDCCELVKLCHIIVAILFLRHGVEMVRDTAILTIAD